jgi:hypothetical protein
MESKFKRKRQIRMGFSRVRYRVMTHENGQKWDVPETEDLRKHDPERWKHTFVRISTDE